MKNIERVREMTPEELTQLVNNRCQMCVYQNQSCLHDRCSEGVIQWLNQDSDLTFHDIDKEYLEFCKGKVCELCKYISIDCFNSFMIDHFNVIDGKITRRQK